MLYKHLNFSFKKIVFYVFKFKFEKDLRLKGKFVIIRKMSKKTY